MKRLHLFVATVGTVVVAGCASTDRQAAVPDEEKTYVTGSRIPVSSGGGPKGVKATSSRQGIDDMLRKGGSATGGVTGAGGG